MSDTEVHDEPTPGPCWERVGSVAGVNRRTVEVVVIPYDDEITVTYDGRAVRETIARGAFDGVETRPNRIHVNRDHDDRVLVGKVLTLHPSRGEGLVADVKISRTLDGDETLALIDDDILGVSAGFLPMRDGLEWRSRDAYTVTRAWLGHIAFTPTPAYDNARVLAVRFAVGAAAAAPPVSTTPLLDDFRAQLAADRAAAMLLR